MWFVQCLSFMFWIKFCLLLHILSHLVEIVTDLHNADVKFSSTTNQAQQNTTATSWESILLHFICGNMKNEKSATKYLNTRFAGPDGSFILGGCYRQMDTPVQNGSKKCAYEVCPNKWHGDDKKIRQNQRNLGHLQTSISQGRKKLLTNFQRVEFTTRHRYMGCVKKSDMGMTKKWGKSTKIWGSFKLQYLKLETSFWQTFKD